jgi:hypothetical protein
MRLVPLRTSAASRPARVAPARSDARLSPAAAMRARTMREHSRSRSRAAANMGGARIDRPGDVVGLPGFEPGTSASRTQRANQTAPQPVAEPGPGGPSA